jgi:chromosome partitioning protein
MKIVSFINYKSGVGKTTLASNIAADLASRGKRVLCIDLDPQASLTFSFLKVEEWKNNFQEDMTIKNWYDDFINEQEENQISNLIVKPARVNSRVHGNLDLICSHLGLINVDIDLALMLGGASQRQQKNNFLKVYSRLREGLKTLEDVYEIILIDCPPNFSIVTQNALVASDYYVAPAKPEYLSTLGLEELQKNIFELVNDYNYNVEHQDFNNYKEINLRPLGMIANMIGVKDNKPIAAHSNYIEYIEKRGTKVFKAKIRESRSSYSAAPEEGIPVVLRRPTDKTEKVINAELKALTNEFITVIGLY